MRLCLSREREMGMIWCISCDEKIWTNVTGCTIELNTWEFRCAGVSREFMRPVWLGVVVKR